jgi:hypothetical protein
MYYILVVGLTVATLITGVIIGSELAPGPAGSRITVIYKNQVQPTIAELEARITKTKQGNNVNSDKAIVSPRRSQWI